MCKIIDIKLLFSHNNNRKGIFKYIFININELMENSKKKAKINHLYLLFCYIKNFSFYLSH
jgi:hypothetical protein